MREWVVGLVGEGMAPFVTTIVAAAIVVLLLLIVVWVARKALGGTMGPKGKNRGPRLAVMDVTVVDQKRKLVLVRRDEVEHLLLIGGQNDVVVEAGILRVPAATGRTQRLEPSLRHEPDAVERAASPAAVATRPAPAAPLRAGEVDLAVRPATARPQPTPEIRAAEPRAASPLTRAVPRPPVAAAEPEQTPVRKSTPAAVAPVEPPIPSPATEPQPVAPAVHSAASRPAPLPSASPESTPAPALPVPSAGPAQPTAPRPPEVTATEADRMVPEAGSPADVDPAFDTMATVATVALPRETSTDRPSTPAAPTVTATETQTTAPLAEETPSSAPIVAPPSPRVEGGSRPLPRQSVPQAVQPAARGPVLPQRIEPSAIPIEASPAPLPRVTIGGGEPARRPSPSFAQPSPRSMATPTYPQKPVPIADSDDREAAEPSLRSDPPSLAAMAALELPDLAPLPAAPVPVVAAPAPSPFAARPSSSPLIAAAERQKEAILARPVAAPDRSPPIMTSPTPPNETPAQPSVPAAPAPEAERSAPVVEDQPRPLSVRSFATAIQSMKPSYEPPTPRAAATPRSEPTVGRPLPVFVKQPVRAEPIPAESKPAEPAKPAELDDSKSLEDFLSAELDSDFSDVRWNDEPPAMPTVGHAPAAAPEVKLDAPDAPPRILTLEEEMERLLGDFDFETSDRKTK